MLESGLSGSLRGVPSNGHPYRDPSSCWEIALSRFVTNEMSKRFLCANQSPLTSSSFEYRCSAEELLKEYSGHSSDSTCLNSASSRCAETNVLPPVGRRATLKSTFEQGIHVHLP